jgi:O-antigen chain-terminating methyltransferase
VARLVGRQTQGVLEQVQAFADPVCEALESLAAAVESLSREVRVDVAQHIDAMCERQAAQERRLLERHGANGSDVAGPSVVARRPLLDHWYSQSRFEDEFRGQRQDILERYRELGERLVGCSPVLDLGCGRGEVLEYLGHLGIEAWGIDLDPEMVKAATELGLPVELGDGIQRLQQQDDGSLGGLLCIQVVEHLDTQDLIDLVALAAQKVRPGGRVFVETVNPQSLYVFARAFYVDPTHLRPVHPAYLTFLFREAGFSSVNIDWRSPPPAEDVLQEVPESATLPREVNANVKRLNQLLFAPQDYLLEAVR